MLDDEQSAFEEHFFTCDACLARVQDLQTLQRVLTAIPRATTVSGVSRARFAWMGAAAASLLLIVTVWEARRAVAPPPAMSTAAPSIQPAEPLAPKSSAPEHLAPPQTTPTAEARILQLAAVTPPQYAALPTRSNEDADAAAFNQAMSRYSAAQYGDAARGLRTLTGRSPGLGHAQFFLGISELMTGDVAAARAALQRAAASDEQPFADESHFYLAKAALRAGNLIEAERQLKISVDREAGPPGDASRLLKELRALPRER